jgi:hypothetical protein
MKTLADFDRELEQLGKQHQEIWGRIMQTRMQRNQALTQYARANARSESAPAVQLSRWNDAGFVNDKNKEFDELEAIR